jgi:hypothetical protein
MKMKNFRDTGRGEAQYRKYQGFKLGVDAVVAV